MKIFYFISWLLLLTYWYIDLDTWLLGLAFGWLFHMVICSIILHKYVTHRTFNVSKWLHPILIYLGTFNLNGSVLAWSNLHRLHHMTSDKKDDPHDPNIIGFINSLFVMNFQNNYDNSVTVLFNLKNCKDLIRDRWIMFFHNNMNLVLIFSYSLLYLISIKALIILFIATGVSFVGLFFTTYVYHKNIPFIQYRNHITSDNSYNNWLSTILFPGEAYHNNHHNDSSKFNTAESKYEFDLTSIIINLIRKK